MAKKTTYDPKNQPGLFDIFDSLPASHVEELPVHPSIEEFVVETRTRAKETARQYSPLDEPLEIDSRPRNSILFKSFGSGSSGNCAFVGDRSGGVLIDAGVDSHKVIDGLATMDLTMNDIRGICLTHDHSDHVRYVYSLVRRHNHIKVYCTPKVLSGIMRRHSISRRLKDYHQPIYKEFPFKIGAFEITAFEVSHDGTDNAGFHITSGDLAMTIATDLGCITDRVDYYMRRANFIVIESNYDAEMLRNGRYPVHLKARIAADNGHLDNKQTARFLSEIRSQQLRNVFLCHLSQDNNTPAIAFATVAEALGLTPGVKPQPGSIRLEVLPRFDSSPLFILKYNGKTDR